MKHGENGFLGMKQSCDGDDDSALIQWRQAQILQRVAARQERRHKALRRRKRFLPWARTANADLEESVARGDDTRLYVASPSFRDTLHGHEPWRLHQRSVQMGTNLHLRIAMAFASSTFTDFIAERATSLAISPDEYLAGIIETIRYIQWETIKVMGNEDLIRTAGLPITIISNIPAADHVIFSKAWETARKTKHVGGLFDKPRTKRESFSLDGQLTLSLVELHHRLAAFSGEISTIGCYGDNITAIYDLAIVKALDEHGNDGAKWRRKLAEIVVEEEIHHQGYMQTELQRRKQRLIGLPYGEHIKSETAIENEMGIKRFRDAMVNALSNGCLDFAPLQERLERRFDSLDLMMGH